MARCGKHEAAEIWSPHHIKRRWSGHRNKNEQCFVWLSSPCTLHQGFAKATRSLCGWKCIQKKNCSNWGANDRNQEDIRYTNTEFWDQGGICKDPTEGAAISLGCLNGSLFWKMYSSNIFFDLGSLLIAPLRFQSLQEEMMLKLAISVGKQDFVLFPVVNSVFVRSGVPHAKGFKTWGLLKLWDLLPPTRPILPKVSLFTGKDQTRLSPGKTDSWSDLERFISKRGKSNCPRLHSHKDQFQSEQK